MSRSRAVAIAIVMAFLVGIFTSDGIASTIRKDYPSGAAANVSHNRPVRMSESWVVVFAIATPFLIDTVASDGGTCTICKGYPSGAATNVSHNRPVRMSSNQHEADSGWGRYRDEWAADRATRSPADQELLTTSQVDHGPSISRSVGSSLDSGDDW